MTSINEKNAECPVVAQGAFGFANLVDIRRFAIGRAVVLTGPGVKRVITPDEPESLMSLLKGLLTMGFTHYTIVDTTAKQTSRTETKRALADPRYSYKLTISMAARVVDPVKYLDDFSASASIFDAFYSELIEDVANALADFHPDDLREAQQRISSWAASIRKSQPYHKGVQILQFNIALEFGEKLAHYIETLGRKRIIEREGEEFLILEGGNDKLIEDLRKARSHSREERSLDIERALQTAKQIEDITAVDMHKIVTSMRLLDRVEGVLPPAPTVREAVGPLLTSSGETRKTEQAKSLPKFSQSDAAERRNGGSARGNGAG